MTTQSKLTALDTVRELHVLYGIAMTGRLEQTEPAICDVYRGLANDIHRALRGITSREEDTAGELQWLIDKWSHAADSSDNGSHADFLYGSWAQNVRSIT